MFSFLRGLVWANKGTKIMALILAVITWTYIDREYIVTATIKVPLVIETPSQIVSRAETLDYQIIKEIEIKLDYPRGAVAEISSLVCKKQVRPAGEQLDKPQTITLELDQKDFNIKPGVTIKNINPNKIQVVLMQETTKYMKIKTEGSIQGTPLKGYRVAAVKSVPLEILVKGPKNILDRNNEVPMGKIDVSNRNAAFSQVGRIELIDKVKLETEESFIVDVDIEEELSEILFIAKIQILSPADFPNYPVQIKPQEKTLKFRGPNSSIKELKARHIILFVNLGSLYTNPADIKPPQSFQPQLELRFSPDAPKKIELIDVLEPIKLDILPLPEPAPASSAEPPK